MECTVSSSMAVVHWYKGSEKLKVKPFGYINSKTMAFVAMNILNLTFNDTGRGRV